MSRWCSGSTRVSKTLSGSSILSRDAKNYLTAEIMKVKDLFSGVWAGKPLKIRDLYNFKDLEKIQNSDVSAQTITIKNNSTGEIVGKRTIYQK